MKSQITNFDAPHTTLSLFLFVRTVLLLLYSHLKFMTCFFFIIAYLSYYYLIYSTSWSSQPFSRGSYTAIGVGGSQNDIMNVAYPLLDPTTSMVRSFITERILTKFRPLGNFKSIPVLNNYVFKLIESVQYMTAI